MKLSPPFFLNFLYSYFLLPILQFVEFFLSFWNKKVAQKRNGRYTYLTVPTRTQKQLQTQKRVWFHAASMGEFEQVKPIIELLHTLSPACNIVASFSSPSGYSNQKSYHFVSHIFYLPIDNNKLQQKLIDHVQPDCIVISRYDLWLNICQAAQQRSIPIILCNATFPSTRLSKYSFGQYYLRTVYSLCSHIWTISTEDYQKFCSLLTTTSTKIHSSFDTRMDRVLQAVSSVGSPFPILNRFRREGFLRIVVGSAWQEEIDLLEKVLNQSVLLQEKIQFIFVPHEPTESFSDYIQQRFCETLRWSDLQKETQNTSSHIAQHLLIDTIGILRELYHYADIAFVGGGFGAGVHSVLEPAAHGIPIVCGPKISRSADAQAMSKGNTNESGVIIVNNPLELEAILIHLIQNSEERLYLGTSNRIYVEQKSGSSQLIVNNILSYLQP